jgi:hypothetical protein
MTTTERLDAIDKAIALLEWFITNRGDFVFHITDDEEPVYTSDILQPAKTAALEMRLTDLLPNKDTLL